MSSNHKSKYTTIKSGIVSLFFFLFSYHAGAADTIAVKRHPSNLRVVVSFDSRYSWINQQQIQIGGFKLGMEWKQRYRAGIGFYNLSSELQKSIPPDKTNPSDKVDARYRFGYYAF